MYVYGYFARILGTSRPHDPLRNLFATWLGGDWPDKPAGYQDRLSVPRIPYEGPRKDMLRVE